MNHYVVGFVFSRDFKRVVLIRKNRPMWQAGKLNGVGGKVEKSENMYHAMERECREECGLVIPFIHWRHFLDMGGQNLDGGAFRVDFFGAAANLKASSTCTDEPVEIIDVQSITPLRHDLVENLCWTLALAVNVLRDGRPANTRATY